MTNAGPHGFRGYVTCREFGGLRIPVPVQSRLLRDYAAQHGLVYKLHVNENVFPHSYLVLEGLLSQLDVYEGIVLTSLFMLPARATRREAIYRRVLEAGASLHMVLEDLVLDSPASAATAEETLRIWSWLPRCPRQVPLEMLNEALNES